MLMLKLPGAQDLAMTIATSTAALLLATGCSAGRLDLSGDGRRLVHGDSGTGNATPDIITPAPVHEWDDPAYDGYIGLSRATPDPGPEASVELLMIPRLPGRRLIRVVEAGDGYPFAGLITSPEGRARYLRDRVPHGMTCSIRLEYEIRNISACGAGRGCLTLELAERSGLHAGEPCDGPTPPHFELVEVSEDASVRFPSTAGEGVAWRAKVATDTLQSLPETGAPPALRDGVAVDLLGKALFYGLNAQDGTLAGGFYDPRAGVWEALPADGAPSTRGVAGFAAAGGRFYVYTASQGHVYDPATGLWTLMPTVDAPDFAAAGANPVALRLVAAGDRLVVWGARVLQGDGRMVAAGAAYDVNGGRWRPINGNGAPAAASAFTLHWTGTAMVVWSPDPKARGVYYPEADTWAAAPAPTNDPESAPDLSDLVSVGGTSVSVSVWWPSSEAATGFLRRRALTDDLTGWTWNLPAPLGSLQPMAGVAARDGWIAVTGGISELTTGSPKLGAASILARVQGDRIVAAEVPGVGREVARPLSVWIGDQWIVWGGCVRILPNGTCVSWARTGWSLRPFLGP